ncbi:axin interactor, dorsalization-associated protein-like isoform X1 [Mytilus californianus]|uniref:axin interactor, dorsalization-associated protein-like isoform X1 n=1 Tax=Mytilus californianus TaxID=6549 RepID=UPI002248418F|nr:axin interactor, dorsalization-associated protein-like isoform X1 [Mytilus californianus]
MSFLDDEDKLIAAWHKAFERCTDVDLWGQPLEAIDGYQRLSKQLLQCSNVDCQIFTDEQKKILSKISICLDLRCKSLQNPGSIEGILLDDLKKIGNTLQNILNQKSKDFPVDVTAAQIQSQTFNGIKTQHSSDNEDDRQEKDAFFVYDVSVKGSLLPKPVSFGGLPMLSIRVEKIGLKDAVSYIDPFITVSVKDASGSDMTAPQDTPIAMNKEGSYLIYNVDVFVQKCIDSLPLGFAIFFELKHYKPKKKDVSTKCWAFMEKDEIKEGQAALELYKKPTDFKRKKLNLLTVKPLYLHLKLLINI